MVTFFREVYVVSLDAKSFIQNILVPTEEMDYLRITETYFLQFKIIMWVHYLY